MIFEFWEQRFLGCNDQQITVELAGESCALLCVRPKPVTQPEILSTDMHFTQGGVEILTREWSPETLTLSGVAKRAPGHSGTITIYVPEGFRPAGAMTTGTTGDSILETKVQFEDETADWTVRFER